jgi:hypothetical protein
MHLSVLYLLALKSFMCPYSMANPTMGIITYNHPQGSTDHVPRPTAQPAAIAGVRAYGRMYVALPSSPAHFVVRIR